MERLSSVSRRGHGVWSSDPSVPPVTSRPQRVPRDASTRSSFGGAAPPLADVVCGHGSANLSPRPSSRRESPTANGGGASDPTARAFGLVRPAPGPQLRSNNRCNACSQPRFAPTHAQDAAPTPREPTGGTTPFHVVGRAVLASDNPGPPPPPSPGFAETTLRFSCILGKSRGPEHGLVSCLKRSISARPIGRSKAPPQGPGVKPHQQLRRVLDVAGSGAGDGASRG